MGTVIDAFTWLLRILWACRVSVINVASSLVLFLVATQAQDLLADLSFQGGWKIPFWATVFFATFMLWAFPVHYGARRTLDEDAWIIPRATRDTLAASCRDAMIVDIRTRYWLVIDWVPRLLGLMPFVVLAFGIRGALGSIGGADALPETVAARDQLSWLLWADLATAIAFAIFVVFRKDLIPDDWTGWLLHPVALLLTGLVFVVAYVVPIWTAIHLPRALLVPPLFGSLVLITSWLQRLGNRTGFPFLLTLAAIAGALTATNAHFDDLRTLPKPVADGRPADERLSIDDAVARWKAANGCTASPCPHPVVIAIDGGASRAAFTAATFVGELIDHMRAPQAAEAASPGRRIFAISGVSGGAYGAAVIQAAILDGQAEAGSAAPPCHSARSTWFGFETWRDGGNAFNWRQCLQALTSGDYLSPTIVGLAFRDFAAPPWQTIGLPPMADRAGLLEMIWEQAYSATMKPGRTMFLDGDRCDEVNVLGLCRRAAHPAAVLTDARTGKIWMPMLFLNGTSVTTGRRLVSADLKSRADPAQPITGGALYAQAYDLREAMSSPCPEVPTPTLMTSAYTQKTLAAAGHANERTLLSGTCGKPAPIDGPDVRLSTAALTSARFPVISPAGIFDMKATRYGDQVVDGGYFENSGITTALDIVAALRAAKIEPILVSIANDPQRDVATEADLAACAERAGPVPGGATTQREKLARCSGLPRRPAPTPLIFTDDNNFIARLFAIVQRPFQTILQTRDGHADEAMSRAEAAFPDHGLYRLKVDIAPVFAADPTLPLDDDKRCKMMEGQALVMSKVSMSWWLSASVQADLDVQRCSLDNRKQLAEIEAAMTTLDALR